MHVKICLPLAVPSSAPWTAAACRALTRPGSPADLHTSSTPPPSPESSHHNSADDFSTGPRSRSCALRSTMKGTAACAPLLRRRMRQCASTADADLLRLGVRLIEVGCLRVILRNGDLLPRLRESVIYGVQLHPGSFPLRTLQELQMRIGHTPCNPRILVWHVHSCVSLPVRHDGPETGCRLGSQSRCVPTACMTARICWQASVRRRPSSCRICSPSDATGQSRRTHCTCSFQTRVQIRGLLSRWMQRAVSRRRAAPKGAQRHPGLPSTAGAGQRYEALWRTLYTNLEGDCNAVLTLHCCCA